MKNQEYVEIGIISRGVVLPEELNKIIQPEYEAGLTLQNRIELAKLLKEKYMDHYRVDETSFSPTKHFIFDEKTEFGDKNRVCCQIVKVPTDKPFYIDNYDLMGEEVWQFQKNDHNYLSDTKKIESEQF